MAIDGWLKHAKMVVLSFKQIYPQFCDVLLVASPFKTQMVGFPQDETRVFLCNQTFDGYSIANDLLLRMGASNKQLQNKRIGNTQMTNSQKNTSTAKSMA